jgi:DNA-binding MarR family transcriptional regulator
MKTSESKFCNCLYFTANALARKVEKLASETWKKTGLAPSHAYLLHLAIEQPGIQAGQLAFQLQLTPSTVTRLIEKLEIKKLVTRTMEGKQTYIYPTQKGKDMRSLIKQCTEEFTETYTKILGEKECKAFVKNMGVMADKLDV